MSCLVKARDLWEGKIHRIQRICCEAFGVSLIDLLSDRRSRDYVVARHVAIWITRTQTIASTPCIGRMFRRDHSTIITAKRNAERLMRENVTIKDTAEKCLNSFLNGDENEVQQ